MGTHKFLHEKYFKTMAKIMGLSVQNFFHYFIVELQISPQDNLDSIFAMTHPLGAHTKDNSDLIMVEHPH